MSKKGLEGYARRQRAYRIRKREELVLWKFRV